MEKKERKKEVQALLALMIVINNQVKKKINEKIKGGIKNEVLLKLFSNDYSREVIDKYINSFPDSSKEEIKLNLDICPILTNIEDNGISLNFDATNKDIIEPLENKLNSFLEKPKLHGTKEKIGTKDWVKKVLRKNNYNSKSIKDFEKEVNSDNELLKDLKEIDKITGTIGIYERLKAVEINEKIHTNFLPYSGLSGRIVSHYPSTQNFPSEWKKYLKPLREGEKIFEIDLRSAEILTLAKITQETKVFDIITKRDFYKYVTSKIFDIKEEEVTDTQRKVMKKVINAINYGVGVEGLTKIIHESTKSKVSYEDGKAVKDEYFNLFPKFKEYQKKQSEITELKTFSGHIFKVDASYKHISFEPQNIIATLIKDLLIALDEVNYTKNIINIVHDSIWISSTHDIANEIKDIMEGIFGDLVEGTAVEGIELTKLTELGGGSKNV